MPWRLLFFAPLKHDESRAPNCFVNSKLVWLVPFKSNSYLRIRPTLLMCGNSGASSLLASTNVQTLFVDCSDVGLSIRCLSTLVPVCRVFVCLSCVCLSCVCLFVSLSLSACLSIRLFACLMCYACSWMFVPLSLSVSLSIRLFAPLMLCMRWLFVSLSLSVSLSLNSSLCLLLVLYMQLAVCFSVSRSVSASAFACLSLNSSLCLPLMLHMQLVWCWLQPRFTWS